MPDQLIRNLQIGSVSLHRYVFYNVLTRKIADPTTLTITVSPPTGDDVTHTYDAESGDIIKSATGTYYFQCEHTIVGRWTIKAVTSGNFVVIKVGTVEVVDSTA